MRSYDIYIYISFVSLSRFFETIYILFKTVECVNMLAHAHTYTYTGKSSARDHLFFTQQRGGYVTRLDTHNQPAVIEAFNAWPRTLTRSYARVPRCRILTLSVNLFSTRQINEGVLVRLRGRKYCCFCLEKSLIGSGITRE